MTQASDILHALSRVTHPELGGDLVAQNRVHDVALENGKARLTLRFSRPARPWQDEVKAAARKRIAALPGIASVEIGIQWETPVDDRPRSADTSGFRRVIAVASGKGGVGKSTTAVNLAVQLARSGARVGILDADVYGPNVPMMMGVPEERPEADAAQHLIPFEGHGVKVMSIGFLVEPGKPVIWRGPMLHNLLRQFLNQVAWGPLDYLLVDLPPGTGDAPLSLVQTAPLSGAVVVTTPQDVSLADVRRSIAMFREVRVAVLGLIENMAPMPCPHCGKPVELFAGRGGETLGREFNVPLLARVPFDPAVARSGDSGSPISVAQPDSVQAQAFRRAAEAVAAGLEALRAGLPAPGPVIEIT